MLLSKCAMHDGKKWKLIKAQEARGLSSKLTGLEVPIDYSQQTVLKI